jgi:large subunit ribosomal protein L24
MAKKAKPAAKGKAAGMKIKKGDDVIVIAGRDRGREGKVIVAYPDQQRVLVHGVNVIRKNKKVNFQGARGAKEGGIVTQEAPIHVSNVMVVDADGKPTRVGYRLETVERPDGRTKTNRIRISRKTGKDL